MTPDPLSGPLIRPWNRQVRVTKAYRDSGGSLQEGSVVSESAYDGLGRRIVKAVKNSGDLDATYHYYYAPGSQSIIEVRNGSDAVLKQYVWGLSYIDELIQTSLNDDPADTTEQDCETHLWSLQDANYNVLGIVDSTGAIVERYEYTPYGERIVYFSPGSNDPLAYAPTVMSQRVELAGGGGVEQPYGVNPVGHQGLMHDEESGLVYNRARMLHTRLGRFTQRDPLGYVDGMGLYQYVGSNPIYWIDPRGLRRRTKSECEWMKQRVAEIKSEMHVLESIWFYWKDQDYSELKYTEDRNRYRTAQTDYRVAKSQLERYTRLIERDCGPQPPEAPSNDSPINCFIECVDPLGLAADELASELQENLARRARGSRGRILQSITRRMGVLGALLTTIQIYNCADKCLPCDLEKWF